MDRKRYLAPALVCLVLGFTLVLQARTLTLKSAQAMIQTQSTDKMVTQLIQVSKERDRLQEELRILRDMATQEANRARLAQQVRQEQAASGLVGVEGRGVIVTLADQRSARQVLVKDLLLVLNELRASGAEAMAVGEVRITERTLLSEAPGGGVAVDGEPINDQIVISAVGDPQVLSAGLTMRGGVLEELKSYYPVSIMEAPLIIIPQATDLTYRYARPVR